MPLQATSGAASYDAFGGGVPVVPNYIEEVFSTYLYDGTGVAQTITNGIDLSTNGGLVWVKRRGSISDHVLTDSANGAPNCLVSNSTDALANTPTRISALTSSGFSIGTSSFVNPASGVLSMVSWTFRKQPKFFDIVTYTGNGAANRAISHNLGSAPGCILVKPTSAVGDWIVYHRGLTTPTSQALYLNTTDSVVGVSYFPTQPTSTNFYVAENGYDVNNNGVTYVAYLFAHDAGGFGLTGTDNVISCGSYTHTSGTDTAVSLGYEPQWLLIKSSSNANTNWFLLDNMRGLLVDGNDNWFAAQSSNAETTSDIAIPQATGFSFPAVRASGDYIYVAIRRGPMKVPTSGTSVFAPITATASTGTSRTVDFPADMTLSTVRTISDQRLIVDRLRGYANSSSATPSALDTTSTAAEAASSATVYNVWNTTALDGPYSNTYSTVWWHFRRAPSFFDEVCYTGTGSAQTLTHNLGATPELIIIKNRVQAFPWYTYSQTIGATKYLRLNTTDAEATSANVWNNTAPTSTQFTVGSSGSFASADGFVAYLFATCAGVSKVGSYTGTATTKQIDCGFTGGARFVLIKKTSGTGSWYVWDSARGIVSGNDPYLLLNSTAAEVTNTDYIDTYSAGFEISSTAPSEINENGGSFIFLAIAQT